MCVCVRVCLCVCEREQPHVCDAGQSSEEDGIPVPSIAGQYVVDDDDVLLQVTECDMHVIRDACASPFTDHRAADRHRRQTPECSKQSAYH